MTALVGAAYYAAGDHSGLGEGVVEKLAAAGVTTVEALADMTPEQLEAIPGIGPKTVEKISMAVNNYFSSLEAGDAPGIAPNTEAPEDQPTGENETEISILSVRIRADRAAIHRTFPSSKTRTT